MKITAKIVSQYVRERGLYLWLNVGLLILVGWLLFPLYVYESVHPLFLTYSGKYSLFLLAITGLFSGLVLFVFLTRRQINKRVFFLSLITLVSLEILVRLILPDPHYRQNVFHHPRPFTMFTGKSDAEAQGNSKMLEEGMEGATIRLNHLGLRIEEGPVLLKPQGETRVFVLGGSTVFNGNPLSNSIPGQLERLFHQDGSSHVRVYNAGVVSSVSAQELSLLLHTVTDYDPDLVIIYNGGNDVHQPYSYDPRPGYPINFVAYEKGMDYLRGRKRSLGTSLCILLHKSKLMRMLAGHRLRRKITPIEQLRGEVGHLSDDWEKEIVGTYAANTRKMCAVAKGFDFRLVVVLHPLLHLKHPLVGQEKRFLGSRAFQDYVIRQYDRIRKEFLKLDSEHAGNDRCFFFDMSRSMSGYDKETYWDFIHTDNAGNLFLASKIYGFLKDKIIPVKKGEPSDRRSETTPGSP